MIDLTLESDRNMVLYYREELTQLTRGLKVHHNTIRILKQKGLIIIQDKRQSKYRLTDLSQRFLKEIAP